MSDPTQPPAFRRRGHIAYWMLGAMVLVVLLPLAVVSWKLIQLNQHSLTTAHQQSHFQIVRSIAKEMDGQVEGLRTQLLRVAKTLSVAVGRNGRTDPAEIREVLVDVTDERVPALQFSHFDQRIGNVSAGKIPAELQTELEPMLARAIEIHAERRGEPWAMLSRPLIMDSGAPVLVVAAPVVSHGGFRGLLWGLIDLEQVWEAVLAGRHLGYIVFALDEQGTAFASSDHSRIAPGRDIRDSPLVDRFLSSRNVATGTVEFTLEEAGERRHYMGAFEQTSQGWGVFVQAPSRQVFQSVQRMKVETWKWTAIALGMAILVGIFTARGLSVPINALAAASRAFAQGDFSRRANVRSRDEIGELAFTFNRMADEIERRIRDLRQALVEKNELFLGTIRALAQAIDAKDPYTRGHSDRVTRYATILAREMGLGKETVRDIHVSAQLHDVGKIGIHDAILQKPGALTDDEFAIMKTHTTKGAEIMEQIPQMRKIIPGLRWHHERADGRGYPDGLTDESIPLMARIIAVADTFDAITTVRPYQQPMTFERARARINELRGVALDAEVVDAFNRACERGDIRLQTKADLEAAAC